MPGSGPWSRGCFSSDRQGDAPPPAFVPHVLQERLVARAVARPHCREVAFVDAVAEEQASVVGVALVGGPDETGGGGNVAMDGGGPQDGLAVQGRTRRDQVSARNTPVDPNVTLRSSTSRRSRFVRSSECVRMCTSFRRTVLILAFAGMSWKIVSWIAARNVAVAYREGTGAPVPSSNGAKRVGPPSPGLN